MHLLYLNSDRTLHDCMDMDETNSYFCDMIKVDLMDFLFCLFVIEEIRFRIIKVIN